MNSTRNIHLIHTASISRNILIIATYILLLLCFQNSNAQSITVQPTTLKNNMNSHIVGVCRNHVKAQSDANANFSQMVTQYAGVTPVFGTQKKLYRLGGSQIDGLVCGGGNYQGYHFQNYGFTDPGAYPYDGINNFVNEANSLNADMIVGVNFGSGTAAEAGSLVQHFKNQNILNKVKFFELGNEINEPHQKGHGSKACTPLIYANNVLPFVTQMKAVDATIKLGYCASTNSVWAWNRGAFPDDNNCANFNSNFCSNTDYNTNGGIQTLNDILSVVGKDNFDYIIFHSYPSWPIIIPSDEGNVSCPGYALTDDQMALRILAQNEWNITNRLGPLYADINTKKQQGLLKSTFQIANTEYFTHVNEKYRPALVGSMTEALYTADNMLTAFRYDFGSAINFSFYHQGNNTTCAGGSTEFSSNPMFTLTGTPKPSFKVHKMIAENMGDVVVGDSDVSIPNVPTFTGHADPGQSFTYKKLSYLSTKKNSDGSIIMLLINRSTDAVTVNINPNITVGSAQIKTLSGTGYTDQNPTETSFTTISNLGAVSIPKLSVSIIKIVPNTCTNNVTAGGTISGNQSLCEAYNPTNITSTTLPTGGTGTLEYIWESATVGSGGPFSVISGATISTYDPPTITQTTWYRRGARRAGCTTYFYSNVINKTVSNVYVAGIIAGDQTACGTSYDPTLITSTTNASGGSGTIILGWEKSTTGSGGPFSVISGATSSTYDPPAITQTTWFRRSSKTGSCAVKYSNVVTKTLTSVCTDVGVTITASPTTYTQYGVVTFTVKAKNLGTTTVNGVIVRCTIPTTMVLTNPPPSVTGGTFNQYCAGGVICWEWAGINLTPSQEHTLTLPLFQNGTGPQTVTATIFNPTAYGDGVSGNNTASVNISTLWGGGGGDRNMETSNTGLTTIRPNPAFNELQVTLPADTYHTLAIYNMDGKNVYTEQVVSKVQTLIDIAALPSGIYLIRLHGKGINEILKFVKI